MHSAILTTVIVSHSCQILLYSHDEQSVFHFLKRCCALRLYFSSVSAEKLPSHLQQRAGSPRPSPFTAVSPNRAASCLPLQQRLIPRQVSALSACFWSPVAHQLHKGVCHRARCPRHVCRPRVPRACQSCGSIGPIVRPRRALGYRAAFRLMQAFQGYCDVVWLSAARKACNYL